MRAVFTASMLVACPIGASDAVVETPVVVPTAAPAVTPVVTPVVKGGTPSTGWGICSMANSVLSTPGSLHSKNPKITGALLLAVVAVIAYRIGAAEADEAKTKEGDLI